MKKLIIVGPVLFILMIGTLVVLLSSTNLLLPTKFKNRYSNIGSSQYTEHQNHVADDGYEDGVSNDIPLFEDEINLSHLQVSELASYNNLQICLIYGEADLDKKKYVTLNEALKTNMVVVHETKEVNQLSLDNNSDEYIYINSGEIVKGGQQDRTIQYDVVIAPREKNIDLASFCVESGRWSARGNENDMEFKSSEKMVSNNDMKLAAKHDKDQSKVWSEVSEYQETTNSSVNSNYSYDVPIDVADTTSASSLELTLENKEIEKIQKEYRDHILKQLPIKQNAMGFAYFINGKLYGIDVYNNHHLFKDLYNKLFDAAIAEAISIYDKNQKPISGSTTAVIQLLAANAQVYQDEVVNANTQFRTSQHNTAKNVLIFTSFDKKEKGWLHRNWLEDTGSTRAKTVDVQMSFDEPVETENNEEVNED